VTRPAEGLRVAIIYDCLFPNTTGGGERVYGRLAQLLAERGARVDYVTRRFPADAASRPFEVVGVWSGEIADADGIRSPVAALRFALAVRRHLRSIRDYDLVIASALPVLTLLAARSGVRRTRTVVVGDWLEVWTWKKWRSYSGVVVGTVARVLQHLGARAADLDLVNSTFTAAALRRDRRSADPIVLGLLDLVDNDGTPGERTEPPYVLYAGRHIADKRVDAIPAALAVARERVPDLTAVIVGEGPETPAVIAASGRVGLTGVIDVAGRVGDEDLGRLLSGAAALVNPSAREGFGLIVAEAAAYGTPAVVVAGEDNASVDLVRHGETGMVAPDAGPESLGGAIADVVAAGRNMRDATITAYRSDRVARSLSASVDELLERYRAIVR